MDETKINQIKNTLKTLDNDDELIGYCNKYNIKIISKTKMTDILDECPICINSEFTRLIKFSCEHSICLNCYLEINFDKCFYRCDNKIGDIHNCSIYIKK